MAEEASDEAHKVLMSLVHKPTTTKALVQPVL